MGSNLAVCVGQYLDDLDDWSMPMKDFYANLRAHGTVPTEASTVTSVSATTVGSVSEIVLPPNPSQDAIMLRQQVLGLIRAASHRSVSAINAVYANFEMASAAVTLLSHAAWDDVQSSTTLKDLMDE
jgi:hypothetical protein